MNAPALLQQLFEGVPAAAVQALQHLSAGARERGLVVLMLGLQEGAAPRDLAAVHAGIALQGVREGRAAAPTLILSAGPVVVADGVERVAQLLLALALATDAHPAIHGMASGRLADCTGLAICRFGPATLATAARRGLDPARQMVQMHAASFFDALEARTVVPGKVEEPAVVRALLLT